MHASQGKSTSSSVLQVQFPRETSEDIEAQIRRYSGKFRRRLRRFASKSARYADLLFTFPAACVAVVTGHGSLWTHEGALLLVRRGATLGDVARALDLPAWLRWLPPEAFDRPLPLTLGARASDAEFARRIVNTLPAAPKHAANWLPWVLAARDACDDAFAVWVAASRIYHRKRHLPFECLLPLAMFAWFSRQQELEAAKFMKGVWTPAISAGRAANLTRRWLLSVLQDLCLQDSACARDWTLPCHVDGFEFVSLQTSGALAEEATAMRNCLATYSASIVWGICRLYSVRRSGLRVADMEVRPDAVTGLPQITRLLGPANSQVPNNVRKAADTWLQLQCQSASEHGSFCCATPTDAAFQKYVWQPYASAMASAAPNRYAPPSVASLLHAIEALRLLERP